MAAQGARWWVWVAYGAAVISPVLGLVAAAPLTHRGEYRYAGTALLVAAAAFLLRFALTGGEY